MELKEVLNSKEFAIDERTSFDVGIASDNETAYVPCGRNAVEVKIPVFSSALSTSVYDKNELFSELIHSIGRAVQISSSIREVDDIFKIKPLFSKFCDRIKPESPFVVKNKFSICTL